MASAEQAPLRIPRVIRPPRLSDFAEGIPREAETVVDVFTQFDPHDGEPISQPTKAFLSFDSKNLYIGWICKDDPKLIRAHVAPRKTVEADDRVTINIDSFADHKHAYWFDVNPYGIQYDGRSTDGIGDDISWESLWYSEGQITKDGYVVLETIPFRSLRFKRAHKQIWYICLARFIQRNNELSIWPAVSHKGLPQFVGQYAPIEIDGDISAGRNIQLIPYGIVSTDRYLDSGSKMMRKNDHHPGLDAKLVIADALTLDLTANPDFSEIGSDDPKVTANQRYEVTYPERRPFFLENASVFSTPEQLFFSRRIVDPQFGAKMTGTLGRWNLGALAADDRAPGNLQAAGETGYGDRAVASVFRGEREFNHQSHAGLFLSDSIFSGSMNRVASLDLRYLMKHNWSLNGQATTTQSRTLTGQDSAGPGYVLSIGKSDDHVNFSSVYTDRSPGMAASLGYLNRQDIRNWETLIGYQWKPKAGHAVLAYGPSLDVLVNYDHEQRLQNWSVTPGFSLSLPRNTALSAYQNNSYELYQNIGFNKHTTNLNLASSWTKWMDTNLNLTQGLQPNYSPPSGVNPFLSRYNYAGISITLRPHSRLRMDEIYYYTRLSAGGDGVPASSLPPRVVFTNHLIRSKVNYQFNRDYSFRAIFDYNANLPNQALVASRYSKQADTTLLFTYLPHPGTAVYLGYADTFENVDFNPSTNPQRWVTELPATSTDRQLFMKFSYLLRF